jgi:hypothetical protein
MGFASSYLDRHSVFGPFIGDKPHRDVSLIVVIPSYNEPDVISSLFSLYNACRPSNPLEIIVVVNSPEGAVSNILSQNRKTIEDVRRWSTVYSSDQFKVYVIEPPPFPVRHAGAGFARKTGMDEAVRRFSTVDNKHGIIISFDADSKCDSNYLTEIEKCFSDGVTTGCTIYFEHSLHGDEPDTVNTAIVSYEIYLRYYVQALRMSGYPYAFHTIGSCFAVDAFTYARQGGMNRKTAGEDFYFLHKIFPLGNFKELNTTRVVPSSRVSERVPFGTGAMMKRLSGKQDQCLLTYPYGSFLELSSLFRAIPELYPSDEAVITLIINQLPENMRDYLYKHGMVDAVLQMNDHSASLSAFRKRFFAWFSALRLLKFLNYARRVRTDQPVSGAARTLLEKSGVTPGRHDIDVLMQYREIQRNGGSGPWC